VDAGDWMGWRELELLERLQFINVQGIRQGEIGYLLSQHGTHRIKKRVKGRRRIIHIYSNDSATHSSI